MTVTLGWVRLGNKAKGQMLWLGRLGGLALFLGRLGGQALQLGGRALQLGRLEG